MDEKLVALAFTRAALTEDVESLRVLLSGHAPSPALLAELVTLCAAILDEVCGRQGALAAIDGWMGAALGARDER